MQAGVKYPNTPESDRMEMVMHVVTLDSGNEVDIMATDPMDAIERVRRAQAGRPAVTEGSTLD